MKKVFLIFLIISKYCSYAQTYVSIPLPNNIKIGTTKIDIKNAKYLLKSKDKSWQKIIPYLPLPINNHGIKQIEININFDNRNGESYELNIGNQNIMISGNDKGIYYGLQSLAQMTYQQDSLQTGVINDTPSFAYRGMHLDVCRHFFSVDEVKKYIDLLARYKFNYFHWHLTDDQGWRIEIKKYPLLTQIGSTRNHTLIGRQTNETGNGKYDDEIESGFYTQEQIIEIVNYALDRKIEVIPEIEMPGHSLAAITSYPYLGCTKLQTEVGTRWGVYDDVLCAGNDSTLYFMQDVLDEVMKIFPTRYIHIGGDEVVKTNWKKCEKCNQKMKRYSYTNYNSLQSYFIKRIDEYIYQKGGIMIGWDEILDGGLAPNATVMSWRGENGGLQAALQNHDVIMTPSSHCYFDHSANQLQEEPLNIGGHLPYKKVYEYNPIPKLLNAENQHYIVGAQGNLWTEYIADWDKLCYMALPRMQALSEVLWTKTSNKSFKDFEKRLGNDMLYLDNKNIAYRMQEPIGFADTIVIKADTNITWTTQNTNDEIFYYWKKKEIQNKFPIIIPFSKKKKTLYSYVQNKTTARKSVVYKTVIIGTKK